MVNDTWSKAINLGPHINSEEADTCPNISFDGKYIFFASFRKSSVEYPLLDLAYKTKLKLAPVDPEANSDIYWIDARVVEQYRPR